MSDKSVYKPIIIPHRDKIKYELTEKIDNFGETYLLVS